MKEKHIGQVSIFEIPLLKGQGYLYCKIIEAHTIVNELEGYRTYLVKVFAYHSEFTFDNIKNIAFELESYIENDILFSPPLLLYKQPRLRGIKKWRFVFNKELNKFDKIIPHFKGLKPINLKLGNNNYEEQALLVITKLNNKYGYWVPLKKAEHLPLFEYSSDEYIQAKLTMEFIVSKGNNILDYFTESEINQIWWYQKIYKETKLFYKSPVKTVDFIVNDSSA